MEDNWKHRRDNMKCKTCMWFVFKLPSIPEKNPDPQNEIKANRLGRCRRNAPSMNGWPALFESDWCGSHKLDENKI